MSYCSRKGASSVYTVLCSVSAFSTQPCLYFPLINSSSHLRHTGALVESEASLASFDTLLKTFPALTAVTFDQAYHLSEAFVAMCFTYPRIRSVTLDALTNIIPVEAHSTDESSPITVTLTSFSLIRPFWREQLGNDTVRSVATLRNVLDENLSRETAFLANVIPRINEGIRQLSLPMETAPVVSMAGMSWPQLQELSLHGRYRNTSQADSLPILLSSVPALRQLSVQICRMENINRAPILGRHECPSTVLTGLRSLTVAYPDPDDDIFAIDTTALCHFSLRDCPRYYHRLGYGSQWGQWTAPILSPAECLSILKRMDLRRLSSLELVYLAPKAGSDDELLQYVAETFPGLSHLEIHRYRANRREVVDYVSPFSYRSAFMLIKLCRLTSWAS